MKSSRIITAVFASSLAVFAARCMTAARASVRSDAAEAHGASFGPDLSADGHLVAFTSTAADLVDGDTNG